MKKQVNGKVVEIKNIELFESAAEGMAINRTISNGLNQSNLKIDYGFTDKVVKAYKHFYDSLPFPLYGIDADIKYCAAGIYIKKALSNLDKITWINSGLWVLPKPFNGYGIHFVNNSWAIEPIESEKKDNCNIRNFENAQGYEDFIWIIASLFSESSTSKYYERFMPKFLEACNNQPMILKWELSNILQFGYVPEPLDLPINRILDLNNDSEYIMDLFLTGYKEPKIKPKVWSLDFDNGETTESNRSKQIPVFGFEAYEKAKINNYSKPETDKMKKVDMFGLNNLFLTMCTIKQAKELSRFPNFKGFIADEWLIYCVDNRVFVSKSVKYSEHKEIGRGVEIFGYKYENIFLSKSVEVAPGVFKEAIYSYGLKTDTLRLCKVQFTRGKRK